MKTIKKITFTIVFLVASIFVIAQDNNIQQIEADTSEYFGCKYMLYTPGDEMITMVKASLTSKLMTINSAGLILFNTRTKKLLAFEVDYFTLDGKIIIDDGNTDPKVLEYTIGDNKAYIK